MKKLLFIVPILLLLAFGAWKLSGLPEFQLFGDLVSRVETQQPVVALTFDDGPSHRGTDAILDILDRQEVKATFFLVGEAMASAPELTRRIVGAGHDIGNHSYTHQRMVLRSPGFVADEIERTDQLIREAGFTGEIFFRPPYGKRLVTLPWYLAGQGTTTVTWDVDPDNGLGYRGSSSEIAEHIIESARPGSIILMHVMFSSRREDLAAVPMVIEGLKRRGFDFVLLPELLMEPGAD